MISETKRALMKQNAVTYRLDRGYSTGRQPWVETGYSTLEHPLCHRHNFPISVTCDTEKRSCDVRGSKTHPVSDGDVAMSITANRLKAFGFETDMATSVAALGLRIVML